MEESKKKPVLKLFLAECVILIGGTGGMWVLGTLKKLAGDRVIAGCVMTLLGLGIVGFHFRREYLCGGLDYNNGDHALRFWFCVGLGLAVAFACAFLPDAGWPFLVIFVMLSLFGNMSTGLLASSVLLMIAVTLGSGSELNFMMYLISGAFAVTLFRHLESDFRLGIPFFLSLLGLLVCETAGIVLVENARPEPEMFVIPVVNLILSGVLLLGCMKLFFSMVVYQYREKYLDINDTENPALVELRERDRQEYMYGIHTAHFCERIGMQLKLDVDALKCAAYYYRIGPRLEEVMTEKQFPPAAQEILREYQAPKKSVQKKETAVLMFSDKIVTAIGELFRQDSHRQVDYAKVIDAIFEKALESGILNHCAITVEELKTMQQLFREEKLYYDFLR